MALHEIYRALGDPVRLEIVSRLSNKSPQTTTEVTEGFGISRQAATKHLAVLEEAGLVESHAEGRVVYRILRREAMAEAETWLHNRARQWEEKLQRLRDHLESD